MKIAHNQSILETSVSHNNDIKKKILINKEEIPKLMMFSESILKPGQKTQNHKHPTMYEIFYICFGKAIFNINGKDIEVYEGDCVTIEPGENHHQYNNFDSDIKFLYFGIAID